MDNPAWTPSGAVVERARVSDFIGWLKRNQRGSFDSYDALWRWSVTDLDGFWSAIWDYFDLRSPTPRNGALANSAMPGAAWFPGVRINYVEQVFRHATTARPAIIADNEAGARREMSWTELQRQVGALAATLRAMGVGPGDRVVAFLPNIPETAVAFLAVASLGAIW